MSVTINLGSSDERSVRVPIAGGLESLLENVRQSLEVEKGVDAPRHIQLRTLNGSLLTEENYGGLTDGDSLEVLVVQAARMPPLQLLSNSGRQRVVFIVLSECMVSCVLYVEKEEEEEEPPTKHSRLSTDFSPDWSNNPSTVSLQSAVVDSVRTPLSGSLLSSPSVALTSSAFASQTFTFPVAPVVALPSPLCASEFGYLQVPLTPSSGGAFILPSLVPVSPSFTSGPVAAAQVIVSSNAGGGDAYQSQSHVASGSKQQGKDIDLHLPEVPVESLFPDQATLSEKLAYMKYLEEHPERKLSFCDYQEEFSQTNSRISRPRSNSIHRTDSQVMSTLNARLRQRVAGAMQRRRSEADIGRKLNGTAAPPLVKTPAVEISVDAKRRKPRRRTSIAEMQVGTVNESGKPVASNSPSSTPGPPPSLIPAHLVSQTVTSEEMLVPAPAGEVEVEIMEEKSSQKPVRRFPSNGTLSEKLAYLKWRESVDEEDEDDLGYQKSAAGGVRVAIPQIRDQHNSPISAFAEP